MIISINWLKKFTDIKLPISELVDLIGSRLVEVEKVVDLGLKYKDVLVVRIISADKIEGSDHLTLTKIDDGGTTDGVDRDEHHLIQVVCGAPNIATSQLVAWLPPKSTIPETFGSLSPIVLDNRKIRGTNSSGMIASARELDLFDEHEGILVLDSDLKPGDSFAEAYELNDYLLDIENKSLTHRPDVFGIIGFAREVAAIQGTKFVSPDQLIKELCNLSGIIEDNKLSVTIDDPKLCSRYQAIVVSGAENKKSPLLIQTYLSRAGIRPINAIVDVTNYLMLLTGQPLHAFDFDKLVQVGGGKADIHVRAAHADEELKLLSGKSIKLSPEDIVIASGDTAIGLAGAMGGANTEIDENTKDIIIESATFNLFSLRGTQMRHGIFSEAITRFTKGQPAELTMPVLCNAVNLIGEWSGAKPITKIAEAYPVHSDDAPIELSADDINAILGTNFKIEQISEILQNAEFATKEIDGNKLQITAPWWRSDIHIIEDIAEEVGRLSGFDNIESKLPQRGFVAIQPTGYDAFKNRLRKIMVRAGANEVLTYSFVHGDVITKAQQDSSQSYRIVNSLSPDLQYYRQSLTPSLVALVHPNIKQGFEEFAIFELNKAHAKLLGTTDENVPHESDTIALVVASKNKKPGAPYFLAKRLFEYLAESSGVQVRFEKVDNHFGAMSEPFELNRSAQIIDDSGKTIGIVGEYKNKVGRSFKLPSYTAGFEVDIDTLYQAVVRSKSKYQPLSRFPSTERDICFRIDKDVQYSQIIDTADSFLKSVAVDYEIKPVDIYQAEGDSAQNITIRVKLNAGDRTLNGDEVGKIIDGLIKAVISSTSATVI